MAPIWLASRHPAYHPPPHHPPHLYRLAFSSSSCASSSFHPGHPTAASPRVPSSLSPCRPISPPYRCSITFAMHFFPSSFFIKLDYNCIASSSCGIAGRKNGTLPGMRVHPRSTGPRAGGSERKAGERVRQGERSVLAERGSRGTVRAGASGRAAREYESGWERGWTGASSRRKKPMRFRGRLIGSRTYTYSPSTNPTVRVLIFAPLPFVAPSPPRVPAASLPPPSPVPVTSVPSRSLQRGVAWQA